MVNKDNGREVAIQLSGVKKMYKLGQIGGATLQQDLQSWWARIRGKDDPNSLVGTSQRLVGQSFMALNGIDLTVYKGEALGIIGGNGAGKSTMLKLLCRVTAPSAGEIDFYGRIASMLEVGTGFNTEMTGRENIYMNGAILGMTKAEIDAKMEDIIEFSEVRDFIDTPVKRYSSGMYVKLAFSVAAHLDSEIMIMDEVLAVGDMAFQNKCLSKMREAATKEGRTVLYVSHNMSTIRQLCDRCIVLDKGKIIYDGDVESAINIYMNTKSEEDVFMDLSDYNRPRWLGIPKARILSVEYVGKKNVTFCAEEPILLRMKWENQCDLTNVCARIEVLNMSDTALASYVAYDLYSGKKGEIAEVTLQLDAEQLMAANYGTRYVLFARDSSGYNMSIDYAPGLSFTKSTQNSNKYLGWNAQQWGHIHLPEPVLIKAEEVTE